MIATSVAAVSRLIVLPEVARRDFRACRPVPERAHEARLHEHAAVGDRRDGRGHLQRRDANLVAHGDRRQRALAPPLRIGQHAARLARQVAGHALAEPEPPDVPAQPLGADAEADLDGADVARLHDHVGEAQDAVVVVLRLGHPAGAAAPHPGARVDEVGRRVDVLFHRRRRGHHLEGGPRLVDALHGPVHPLLRAGSPGRCSGSPAGSWPWRGSRPTAGP